MPASRSVQCTFSASCAPVLVPHYRLSASFTALAIASTTPVVTTPVVTTAVTMVNGKSFYRRKLPAGLVEFASEEGKKRFESALAAGTADAFFPLIDPGRVWMDPWRWFAESLLDCCLDLEIARTKGVTMDQLAQTARCNGADVSVLRNQSVDDARAMLLRCVRRQERGAEEFAAVSFSRHTLSQTGDGHYSPIAAIDVASDSALVLDTARFKYGPYWVDLSRLVAATKPEDTTSGLPRGFLTFKKARAPVAGASRTPCADKECRVCVFAPAGTKC